MFSIVVIHFFFFNDTATTEIYTLSLHDALPISEEQIYVRMDDKLSRIANGEEDDEDPIQDLAGYLVILMAKRLGEEKNEDGT